MRQERPYRAEDVQKIVVRGSRVTMDHVGWKYVPQGLTSAQLNLPYCVGTFLLENDCGVDQFTEDKVADAERIAYSETVEVHEDPDITAKGAKFRHMVRVELRLKDGTKMERTVEAARGSEQKFASEGDIVEKFEKLATKALPRQQVEELRETMLNLEKMPDANRIGQLLARA
jgi:2-methylcitrate dehydratase PrpD